ncbi:class I SAM-dependent methyltransferase [Leptolinea tardivitalis]|uniref:Methyltransferase type 11 domain-containing protein n=1 Tax=Leptolinea tardivitalis TaxID=229920 RepID=A0A0P6WQX1_9CHLR|nr:class I SAM-dependent methyltransferase [Leptolinea tardivitalis]KPL71264.1 hypothetical protein ADM99_11170 [Leptolinea tardivitalis]GAP23029.1 methylase [Leptolinea tardivitalis]
MTFSKDIHNRFKEQASWTYQVQELFFKSAHLIPQSNVLEVGCGTGAFLQSLSSIGKVNLYGIDIQPDLLTAAQTNTISSQIACADANSLPFEDNLFDAVLCHYFLLWIKNIDRVLGEMYRVLKPGGMMAALAEPDYGSQINYPSEFSILGEKQRESLIRQGANPDFGRQLPTALARSGCSDISFGIMGAFQQVSYNSEQIKSEQQLISSDIHNEISEEALISLLKQDTLCRVENTRVHFIPTFYAWGKK